jgi:hypothetical protein
MDALCRGATNARFPLQIARYTHTAQRLHTRMHPLRESYIHSSTSSSADTAEPLADAKPNPRSSQARRTGLVRAPGTASSGYAQRLLLGRGGRTPPRCAWRLGVDARRGAAGPAVGPMIEWETCATARAGRQSAGQLEPPLVRTVLM